ncbi:hypothetical protein C4D60_Mb11t12670 [Musa balbisiana]|uniref:Histone H2A n=1 Tax=Musa balbisiana TaxID=52838 RepID=A0A4S8J635_MUSBA|nr:hypothetical protein C4D60_Mb11t12670 [Musa balbisiana]
MVGRGKSIGSAAAKKSMSRSSKAGLQFPVGRIARFLAAVRRARWRWRSLLSRCRFGASWECGEGQKPLEN